MWVSHHINPIFGFRTNWNYGHLSDGILFNYWNLLYLDNLSRKFMCHNKVLEIVWTAVYRAKHWQIFFQCSRRDIRTRIKVYCLVWCWLYICIMYLHELVCTKIFTTTVKILIGDWFSIVTQYTEDYNPRLENVATLLLQQYLFFKECISKL